MSSRRADLLALTLDDLATLSNRGLVKRAQKELESGSGPADFDVDDHGTVTAEWPDGSVVTLPAGAALSDRCCTCAALTICRHIIGTVLTYQTADCGEDPPAANQPWDPGTVSDAVMESYWKPPAFAAIRRTWAAGTVAEVQRSHKPLARLYSAGVTMRFLVPNDVRYVQCDCAEPSPCRHVPLAVWAFRELPAAATSGLIAANQPPHKAPEELRGECERLVSNLFQYGVADLPPIDVRVWEGLAARLRRAGLMWPEQIVLEWLALRQQYLDRDARFDPADLIQRSAELLIRMRAICANTGSVPQLFLRGAREVSNELGSARLVGLGTAVSVNRKSVRVTAMLQDLASGAVLSVGRETAGHDKSFHELGEAYFTKKLSLSAAGAGQMLVKGAKRTLAGELALTRAAVALNAQAYEWEKLRPPMLVEGADELRSHLENLPPAVLGPRDVSQAFHVIAVAQVVRNGVNPASRRLIAAASDAHGGHLLLEFPYYSHGRPGFVRLYEALARPVCFVAGRVRRDPLGLMMTPSAVIVEDGPSRRTMIQPWVDSGDSRLAELDSLAHDSPREIEPFALFRMDMRNALGEAALTGLTNADPIMEQRWRALIEQGREVGLQRFLEPAAVLHREIESRKGSLAWDASTAVEAAVRQAVLAAFC